MKVIQITIEEGPLDWLMIHTGKRYRSAAEALKATKHLDDATIRTVSWKPVTSTGWRVTAAITACDP